MAVRWSMRTDNPCRGIEPTTRLARERSHHRLEMERLTSGSDSSRIRGRNIIRLLLLTGARSARASTGRGGISSTSSGHDEASGGTKQGRLITYPRRLSAATTGSTRKRSDGPRSSQDGRSKDAPHWFAYGRPPARGAAHPISPQLCRYAHKTRAGRSRHRARLGTRMSPSTAGTAIYHRRAQAVLTGRSPR